MSAAPLGADCPGVPRPPARELAWRRAGWSPARSLGRRALPGASRVLLAARHGVRAAYLGALWRPAVVGRIEDALMRGRRALYARTPARDGILGEPLYSAPTGSAHLATWLAPWRWRIHLRNRNLRLKACSGQPGLSSGSGLVRPLCACRCCCRLAPGRLPLATVLLFTRARCGGVHGGLPMTLARSLPAPRHAGPTIARPSRAPCELPPSVAVRAPLVGL